MSTEFPNAARRLMRNRATPLMRDLLAGGGLTVSRLIQPLFIVQGLDGTEEIPGLPDNERMGLEASLARIEKDLEAGVRQFMLFAIPEQKGDGAPAGAAIIKQIKSRFGADLHLWADTCLCSSTPTGHCCLFREDEPEKIDLEATLKQLARYARAYAEAGADGIAPSDMMDARVAVLRRHLDETGHEHVPIMSYSTKFASEFYGPFRGAAGSAPSFGDRRQYQIDVRNRTDALNASLRCAEEGADMLMVKPGMTSIDLIAPIRELTGLPVGAYQVSGEYASLALLAREGLTDFDRALRETWHVFERAGAQFIITYGARRAHELGVPRT